MDGIIMVNGLPVATKLDSRGVAQGLISTRMERLAFIKDALSAEMDDHFLASDVTQMDVIVEILEILDNMISREE